VASEYDHGVGAWFEGQRLMHATSDLFLWLIRRRLHFYVRQLHYMRAASSWNVRPATLSALLEIVLGDASRAHAPFLSIRPSRG